MLFSGRIELSRNANCLNVEHFCPSISEFRSGERNIIDKHQTDTEEDDRSKIENIARQSEKTHLNEFQQNIIGCIAG